MLTQNFEVEPLTILIVDDEPNIRKTLSICLETEGHKVIAVSNQPDALSEVKQTRFDMVFLDIRLGTESGLNLLPLLLEAGPWMRIVMITAHSSIDSAVAAMRLGAFDYLPKPYSTGQVIASVNKVAEIRKLETQIRGLQSQLQEGGIENELKSHSVAMQRALDLAKEVAKSEAIVLITGESGTGKGVLARMIHAWSTRQSAVFGTISCPSLSPDLLESELFGHAKGAFTGAVRQNPGRIAGSEKGTLFLDEVGDLPLSLQAKLLRFIQDREYESVGDNVTKRADVRIIAATNVNLREAVKNGRFREDLYYRLHVIPIHMPALRDRPEDIPLLAGRFLAGFAKSKSIVGFSDEALQHLKTYAWPGNVRELRNVIERAAILCHETKIEAKHLTLIDETIERRDRIGDMLSLDQIEEAHIRRILGVARSMEEASRILGIDTVTLWRRRKKYGL